MTALIAESVVESALRGLLFAAAVGAGFSLLRVRHVPARKAAWTLVLIASIAMPLLMRWPLLSGLRSKLAWAAPIPMTHTAPAAARPAGASSTTLSIPVEFVPTLPETSGDGSSAMPAPPQMSSLPLPAASSPTPNNKFTFPPIQQMAIWLYLAVAGALLLRLLFGLATALRLWLTAEPVSPLVAPDGNVRSTRRITSPVTVGSGIVLPADYTQWDLSRLRMVLAHERSHVRQMDFWLQLLAGLYTAAFWFSPLGWFLRRKLAQLGEAMSDRAGMEAAQSSSAYAQVVLDFASLPRRRVPGVAMASSGNLSRRIDALLNEHRFRSAFAEGRRRALLSLLLIPAALFAATALIRVPIVAAQTAPPSQDPSPASPAVAPPQQAPAAAPRSGQAFAGQAPNAGQVTGAPPQAPTPPQAVPAAPPATSTALQPNEPMILNPGSLPVVTIPNIPPISIPDLKVVMPKMPDSLGPLELRLQAMKAEGPWNGVTFMGPGSNFLMMPDGGARGYAYYFSSNGDSWAIVDAKGNHLSMGSGAAKRQLDLAQRMAKGPFLWFTHDGKSYIVDDPTIVARIRALYQPMKALDRQQENFAVQQRVFARMDEEMARSFQSSNTIRVPDLSKEMADAEAALQSLKSEQGQMLSEEKLAEVQSKLAEVEARLGSLEARASVQNSFGEKMREMGDHQRQLGEQQRQLGQQQKKLADQAQRQVEAIIQQCLKEGKATEVR
jgi:hypothetical protein